ncbi:hypothetical protein K9M59_04425 [Candidatus Gracilibacteria bacterium]|nr:hypothetical protein [Candidatus Gracilibacteria bacterium]MCF7819565.1 hypothetical protein [Candidatus Gracilibacteria bacterium]
MKADFGDFIFFRDDSLLSRMIRFFDGRSDSGHVGMILGTFEKRILFVESNWKGVDVGMLNERRQNFEILPCPLKPVQPLEKILDEVAKKYDVRHFFWTGMNKFSLGLVKPPPTDDEAYICSELVNWIYGYQLSPKGEATPHSIYMFVKK